MYFSNKVILRIGNFFFRFRNSLFPLIFTVAFVLVKPTLFFDTNRNLDQVAIIAGIVIALMGAGLRLSVIGLAYIIRGGRNRKIYAEDLITTGLYAHCRNPMYVGNILIGFGLSILYGSPILILGVFPFFIFTYYTITKAEEQFLFEKFGESYRVYCKHVPRFWFKIRGITDSFGSFRYDWKKVLRSEYGTFAGTASGIILILAWKMHHVYDYKLLSKEIGNLIFLLLPVGIFYLSVRILKLRGWLKSYERLEEGQLPTFNN